MASEWFVKADKGVSGPFTASEISELARAGKLGSTTLVRSGQRGSWRPARLVRGLLNSPPPRSLADRTSVNQRDAIDPTWAFAVAVVIGGTLLSTVLLFVGLKLRRQTATAVAVGEAGSAPNEAAQPLERPRVEMVPDPIEPPEPKADTLEEVMDAVAPSVALVTGRSSSGTGFVIEPGVVVTNKHVLRTECIADLRAAFPSASRDLQGPQPVTLIYKDPDRDLAFLRVNRTPRPLRMTVDHTFKRGQEVTVVGNPAMTGGPVLVNAVSRGIMSTEATLDGQHFFQIGVSINPGNSGGPVLDSDGSVLGVVTLKDQKKEGLGFCIPPKEVAASIGQMKTVSDADILRVNDDHDFQVVVFEIAMRGALAKVRMDSLVTAMDRAIDSGGKAVDGIEAVARKTGLRLTSQEETADLQGSVTRIARNPRYTEATRQRLADLWATVQSMVSYAEDPRGSLNSYSVKARELFDDFDRQFQPLRMLASSPFE